MKLVLHPLTQAYVQRIILAKPHAVLLVARNGTGKGALAQYIAGGILGAQAAQPYTPYIRQLQPDEKNTISVEAIRGLQQFVRLKTIGDEPIRRAIIIEHADAMTTEAQNAFLKLLEEPPADTVILLTAKSRESLLPTILSRVQEMYVQSPEASEVQAFFARTMPAQSAQSITQAYFMSGGAPGLMTALLGGEADHPLVQAVALAKQVLQQDNFERLASIDQVKQKTDALELCTALERIAQVSISQAAAQSDAIKMSRWHNILRAATEASELISKNVQTKLALTHLMLQL
ncbi:MAG TPA: AAA family ATPase [Candidatus Saccharimonadales bacterium]|nr:AAA family ATPase [Candidatus Saccharimonadales bacterium]